MSDPRFLQKGFTKQLAHVIEEAGEMLAAAGKTQRWGLKSFNPLAKYEERESNRKWLKRELIDLRDAINRLLDIMAAS